ncbi:MAG: hypothetical protein KDI46_03725 [Alphaproteobacteria bacterium]|nr:hypothetical protein [Alphaproteobacteria bacterium]
MTDKNVPQFFINAFYESKFRDSLFIVKASGAVVEDESALDHLMADIQELTLLGIKVVFVYGGGELLDRAVEERGLGVKRENGRRVTDQATLDLMKEVIGGSLSLKIYQSMARHNIEGLSLNAVPYDWLNISLRPKAPVDFGFVGDIHSANVRPVRRLLKSVNFVAVPCLAWAADTAGEGTLCNINADTIATELAIGTQANKLIFMSNVDGVQIGSETAFVITSEEIEGLIENGTVTGGMQVKLENCRRAMEAGVRRIHLINGLREHALHKEIFESVGPGTMLLKESERRHYMNEVEAQKAIGGRA